MSAQHPAFTIIDGQAPLITTAIHAGHAIRDRLLPLYQLSGDERLREEDPATDIWAELGQTRVIGNRSRFMVDLNRPRDKAVYQKPEDAWGLDIWQQDLPQHEIEQSLQYYDDFYAAMRQLLDRTVARHGCFVVYDIHSYNHRRAGADAAPADPKANPEVNIGTGNMNRQLWAPVVDGFIQNLRAYPFQGRQLDVRENVKFQGGAFSRWIHDNYPDVSCVLAVEFKKIYMDEWTGELYTDVIGELKKALASTIDATLYNMCIVARTLAAQKA